MAEPGCSVRRSQEGEAFSRAVAARLKGSRSTGNRDGAETVAGQSGKNAAIAARSSTIGAGGSDATKRRP